VTLAATSHVLVVQAQTHRFTELEHQSTFARWLATGRTTPLGDELPGPDLGISMSHLAVAGRYVAYALTISGGESPEMWKVCRLNVQVGLKKCVGADLRPGAGGFPSPGGGVRNVAATPKGTVAWIAGGAEAAPATEDVLVLAPGASSPTLLASGAGVDPSSLAAVPGHLYWTEAGAPRMVAIR
jgi:hypothetical protein